MGVDNFKAMIGARQPKPGHFLLEFAPQGMRHIRKNAGCDWVAFAGADIGIDGMRQAIAKGASLNG